MRTGDSVRAVVVATVFFACMAGIHTKAETRFAALEQPVTTARSEAFAGSSIAVSLRKALTESGASAAAIAEAFDVYGERGGDPIWLEKDAGKARTLVGVLAQADAHALPVARYRPQALSDRLDGLRDLNEKQRAALEADLTAAFASYARDVSSGLLEPVKIDPEIEIYPERMPLDALLREVAIEADVASLLVALPPQSRTYRLLQDALAEARMIDPNAWGPEVPEGRTLKIGIQDARVRALRGRLTALGFAPTIAPEGASIDLLQFDEALEGAVMRFQADRGLVDDGIVGTRTLAALNQSPRDRVAQIAVNMERLRWHNHDLGWRHILVNQAAFEMTLFENGAPLLESRVIIGQAKEHRTAEFSDEMEYLVFNPYWNVPKSIAREEILPILKKDPGYLARNNMTATPWQGYSPPPPPGPMSVSAQPGQELAQRDLNAPYNPALERARAEARAAALADLNGEEPDVGPDGAAVVAAPEPAPVPYNPWLRYSSGYFPYTIRQNPGVGNALGDVKFLFPNHHSIYLHDTPTKKLFARERRDFSHGCVRIQKPLELAEILLGWQTDDPTDFMRKMLGYSTEKWITLRDKLPVHLTYRTARLNTAGALDFLPDVYGRDALVAAALEAEGVSLR